MHFHGIMQIDNASMYCSSESVCGTNWITWKYIGPVPLTSVPTQSPSFNPSIIPKKLPTTPRIYSNQENIICNDTHPRTSPIKCINKYQDCIINCNGISSCEYFEIQVSEANSSEIVLLTCNN